MSRKFLSMRGIIAPVLFAFTAVLGGVLRPGYSHLSDAVSELFTPASPNKLLLDALHTGYALLFMLFGIGVLQMIRRSAHCTIAGIVGALLYIASGVLSVATASVFPQDPWRSPTAFADEMHKYLSGALSLTSLIAIGLIGHWFARATAFSRCGTYSWITIGLAVISAAFFAASQSSPIMELAERIAALVGFQWMFARALRMSIGARTRGSLALLQRSRPCARRGAEPQETRMRG